MKPSEAKTREQYLRLLQAKRDCPTCKPLREQMNSMYDKFDNEAVLIRVTTTNHKCPGTES